MSRPLRTQPPLEGWRRRFLKTASIPVTTGLLWSVTLLLIPSAYSNRFTPEQSETTGGPQREQAAPFRNQNVRPLELGKAVEQELGEGEIHYYTVPLSSGQFLQLRVDQRGIDLVATISAPEGKPLDEFDATGKDGAEVVFLIADASGDYRLQIQARDKKASPGRYEIRMEELRLATRQDKNRVAARKLTIEADRLRSEGKPESLRRAIEKYKESVSLFHEASDYTGYTRALRDAARLHTQMGEYEAAAEVYRQLVSFNSATGDSRSEAKALIELGFTYRLLGENQKALDVLLRALSTSQALGERSDEGRALNHLGVVYTALGDTENALDYLGRSLAIWQSLGDRWEEATTVNNIGIVHSHLGESQKALDHLHLALQLRRTVGDRRGETNTLINIGVVYTELDDNPKALENFEAALHLSRSTVNPLAEATALNNLGTVHIALTDYRKALECLVEALSIRRRIGDRIGIGYTLNNMGRACINLGEHHKAIGYLNEAIELSRETGEKRLETGVLNQLARAYRANGDFNRARSYFDAAMTIIESRRMKLASSSLRSSYFTTVKRVYEGYVDFLVHMHRLHPAEHYDVGAFEASERGRARSLLEDLNQTRVDIRQGVDPALIERERTLRQLLNAKTDRQIRLLSGKHTQEEAGESEKEIAGLTAEYEDTETQIKAKSPRYAAVTQPEPMTLKEIQTRVLDPDTLMLEYALGEERSHLFAVTSSSISIFELPKRAEIETASEAVYKLLTARLQKVKFETPSEMRDRILKADVEYPKAAAALSRMLLGPIATKLGSKRLLVIADGALQYLPFGALPVPETKRQTGEWRPLIADHGIVSLPSASTLAVVRRELRGRKAAPKTIAVFADPVFDERDYRVRAPRTTAPKTIQSSREDSVERVDSFATRAVKELGLLDEIGGIPRLPFTRKEAEAVTRLVKEGDYLAALDFEASRAAATRADLDQYRIVHFATHALLNSNHPNLSGIVLSMVDQQGAQQPGFLALYDVYNLRLNADLVVLSSCRTGLGKAVRGEGMIGLTRGFIYAGAARVMVSLWSVHDESTSELMKRFYRGMLGEQRLSPAAALRAAQMSMWKEKKWQAPYYWAGFVLQGEYR